MKKLQKLTHIPKYDLEAESDMKEELRIVLKHMETSCEDYDKMEALGLKARAIQQKMVEMKHYSIKAKKTISKVKSIGDISTRAYTCWKSRDSAFFGEILEIQDKSKSLSQIYNGSD